MLKDYGALFARNGHFILFGMLMMALSGPGQTFFFSYFIADIRADFNLSHSEFGALYSAATLCSAFLILFTGPLIDNWRLTHYVGAVLLGVGVSSLVLGLAEGLPLLFLGFVLARHFGQGLCMHTTGTAFGRSFDRNRGRAVALGQIGLPVGETLLSIYIVWLLTGFHWQQSLIVTGLGVLFVALPVQVWLARNEPDARHDRSDKRPVISQSRSEILRDWRFYAITVYYIGSPTLLTGLFLNQALLAQERDWPLAVIAYAFAFYAGMKICISLIVGPQIDRFGARNILPLSAIPLVLALACLLMFEGQTELSDYPVLPFIYMGLVGANVGINSASTSSLWPELYGTQYLGAVRSLVSTITTFGTACSPVLAGVLLDLGFGYDGLVWASLFYTLGSLPIALAGLRKPASSQ